MFSSNKLGENLMGLRFLSLYIGHQNQFWGESEVTRIVLGGATLTRELCSDIQLWGWPLGVHRKNMGLGITLPESS